MLCKVTRGNIVKTSMNTKDMVIFKGENEIACDKDYAENKKLKCQLSFTHHIIIIISICILYPNVVRSMSLGLISSKERNVIAW